jgi:hypothetical protein
MIAVANTTILETGQTVAFGENFKVVNEFVYFGALVTPKNDVYLEKPPRIQTANRCSHPTLIRPVLLNSSET